MATQVCSGQQATDLVSLETRDKRYPPCHLSVTLKYYTQADGTRVKLKMETFAGFFYIVFSESKKAPEKRKKKHI